MSALDATLVWLSKKGCLEKAIPYGQSSAGEQLIPTALISMKAQNMVPSQGRSHAAVSDERCETFCLTRDQEHHTFQCFNAEQKWAPSKSVQYGVVRNRKQMLAHAEILPQLKAISRTF